MSQLYVGMCGCDYAAKNWGSYYLLGSYRWIGFPLHVTRSREQYLDSTLTN